ncbi:MAG: lipid IV(A) 3-deoxy-D-manno-octulosonic acid transferase [Burkholderiaceae bacterium]
MARWFYSIGWLLATPLALVYLMWRSRRQPGYRQHLGERFGLFRRRRDDRPLLWLHAVSVGETRAAQPLLRALLERYPRHELLLTHMTPTGRETGAELFAGPRVHQAYLPYDQPWALRRFLRAWRPAIGIVMETELWPNLVAVARAERVPLAFVNVRLSPRSLRKGLRWSSLIRPAVAGVDLVLAQTRADAQRLAALGRDDAQVVGNMKFDVTPAPALEALGHRWRLVWLSGRGAGGLPRACVLAASTRDGEEAPLLDAWVRQLGRQSGGAPLLIVVPRHPQRFDEVAELIARHGLRYVRRSALDVELPADCDVVLGDSMGEMAAYYAAADVAILGGSLLPFGGQNLIEACAASVPVIMGPHTYNFAEAAAQAIDADAAQRVVDAEQAVSAALALAMDVERRQSMGERAADFAERHRGATARTVEALAPLIERRSAFAPRSG